MPFSNHYKDEPPPMKLVFQQETGHDEQCAIYVQGDVNEYTLEAIAEFVRVQRIAIERKKLCDSNEKSFELGLLETARDARLPE